MSQSRLAGVSGSWAGLHRLQASFERRPVTGADERAVLDVARRLGSTAVPLCTRELGRGADRRAWAVRVLRVVAETAGDRVRAALRAVVDDATSPGAAGPSAPSAPSASAAPAAPAADDDTKLAVLGLLAELGDETATAHFADPARVHRQSLARFATQLDTAADVASAADLLVSRLSPEEIVQFVDAFAEASPDSARRLADELCARVDLDVGARGELARIAAPLRLAAAKPPVAPRRPLGRPGLLVGLRHADGRAVVAVARRATGARRWRALCVACDADGTLASALYRDDATLRALRDDLITPLEAEGYARFPVTVVAARRLVGAAARRTVAAGQTLASAYYLGRDLLGLTDAHVVGARAGEPAALLGRAVDLLAAGDSARARPLLEHCASLAPDDAEVASSLGLCLLAQGVHDGAVAHLERAAWLEPAWPLHHWNLAAAAHRAGSLPICARALREFLRRADEPLAAAIDPGHARRVSLARRFLADHARYHAAVDGPPPVHP